MPDTALIELTDFLKEKVREIKLMEEKAQESLHAQTDQGTYRAIMADKAKLLAGLNEEAKPLVAKLPQHTALAVGARLQQFSNSAQNSLNIGSVFYMSALLYPENHTPGDPNDLETFIASLASGDFS